MTGRENLIDRLVEIEGGYISHSHQSDKGKQTFAGISRHWHPDWPGWAAVDMGIEGTELRPLVHEFYQENFLQHLQSDQWRNEALLWRCLSACVVSLSLIHI